MLFQSPVRNTPPAVRQNKIDYSLKQITMKQRLILLSFLLTIYSQVYSQKENLSSIERFSYTGYEGFREYLQQKGSFPSDAFYKPGVLIAGMILDVNGKIINVFSLNSISPEIDNTVLDLIESTAGHWQPMSDSLIKKNEIIIIPIVFCLKNTEQKIDKDNFKLTIQKEVYLTALRGKEQMSAIDYESTSNLLEKYKKLISKSKNQEAVQIIDELLRREPLNVDYYGDLIRLENQLGNKERACQYLKFVKEYFINQPDETTTIDLKCD
jgi:hypothetical protein